MASMRLTPGRCEIDGAPVTITSPKDAITAGIGMVHQNFLQVDVFTVTENIVLGTDSSQLTAPDGSAQTPAQRIAELSERFGLTVDPSARVADLPVGVRQRVEILKALYRGAKILVLDEPTTNLTPQEVDDLFSSMRAIVDDGMSVVLITHKIRETMEVCDRMTVMRDGRWIATVDKSDTTADDLAATMIGEVAAGDPEAAGLAQAAQVALGEEELGEASLDSSNEANPEGAAADTVTPTPARVTVRGLTVAGKAGQAARRRRDALPPSRRDPRHRRGGGQRSGRAGRGVDRNPFCHRLAHALMVPSSWVDPRLPGWAAVWSMSPRTGSATAYSRVPGSPRTSCSDRTGPERRPA